MPAGVILFEYLSVRSHTVTAIQITANTQYKGLTHYVFTMKRLHQPAKAKKACIWSTNLSFSFQIQGVLMKSGLAS